MTEQAKPWPNKVLGVLVVFAGFSAVIFLFRALGLRGDERIIRELAFVAFGGAVLYLITQIEGRSLASIGLRRPTWSTLGWSLGATICLMLITAGTYTALMAAGLPTPGGDGGSGNPMWLVVIIALRAAFVEELVFRGYILERLESVGLSSWAAVLISAGLFIVAHFSFNPATIFFLLPAALFFGIVYVWKRDLIVCIAAHAIVDFAGLAAAALQSR